MIEYKRLTKKDKYGHWYTDTKINDRYMWSKDGKAWERDLTHYAFDGEAIDRLAELEDKIEDGTLVELSCKCIEELDIIKDGMIFIFYKICLEQNLGQRVFLEYKSKINEWFKNYLKNKELQEKEK